MTMKTKPKRKVTVILALVFIVLAIAIFLASFMIEQNSVQAQCDSANGTLVDGECLYADKQMCEDIGGTYQKHVLCVGGGKVIAEDGKVIGVEDTPEHIECVNRPDEHLCILP